MRRCPVPSGLALTVRGLRAAVWTTMNSGKPVILVVEDEVLIRMMAVRVAEDSGFEALSAASADEAIGILESRSDVRLVFTDVNMPGSMNGLRFAHAVRGRWPPAARHISPRQRHRERLARARALSAEAL
jgi:CheY-like chemotaxis protein